MKIYESMSYSPLLHKNEYSTTPTVVLYGYLRSDAVGWSEVDSSYSIFDLGRYSCQHPHMSRLDSKGRMGAKGVGNSVHGPWMDGELIFNLFKMMSSKLNHKSHDTLVVVSNKNA